MRLTVLGLSTFILVGCASDDHERPELRAALDRATIDLRDSVGVALNEVGSTVALRAKLVMTDDPVFSVGALDEEDLKDVRIDLATGRVVSTATVGSTLDPCEGTIPLSQALVIAEEAASGDAIAVAPDDDVECAREIQVLSGIILYEVKVARDGDVLEQELSDEYSGEDDD